MSGALAVASGGHAFGSPHGQPEGRPASVGQRTVYARYRRDWTPAEVKVLRRHYASADLLDLALRMGRPPRALAQKASTLGLHRSRKRVREAMFKRVRAGVLARTVKAALRRMPDVQRAWRPAA